MKEIRGVIGFEHLKISCIIGVNPQERECIQEIFVDIRVEKNITSAASTDDLKETLDYVQLANICKEVACRGKFFLIEKYAFEVLSEILKQFDVNWAWIKVKKPLAIPDASFALFELKQFKKENLCLGH